MPAPIVLLKCIGKAVLKAAIKAVPLGDAVLELAIDAYGAWSKETDEECRRAEVQALAQVATSEVRDLVAGIIQEIAGTEPEAIRRTVANYLTQVPTAVHQSLRRPADPTGTSLPPALAMMTAEDLIPLLPTKLPRFKPGERPLSGVDWELVELLGAGGFGEVWKARNPYFDGVPPVALKFCLDPTAKDRLLRHEAAVLNQVMRQGRHPGIVPLRHTYLSADPPCLEYEFVSGGDMAGWIQDSRSRGGVPPSQAAAVVQELAGIVGFAHRLHPPIVHRDLKPANILVEHTADMRDAFRIADFGIGGIAAQQAIEQSTRLGIGPGQLLSVAVRGAFTPLYASPQQVRGLPPDPRDDVYSLGVIWYQLLTGDLSAGCPGGGGWRKRLAERGMATPLIDLLEACIEDSPADRPADAAVLAERLAEPRREPAMHFTNSLGMKFALLPAGTFRMGSPPTEQGRCKDENRQHDVEITRPFHLGMSPVTQAQWQRVMGSNPSHFCSSGEGKDKITGLDTSAFPVEQVSWEEAVVFCRKLSELPEGRSSGRVYRLPTEAEWEYSCRGGTSSVFAFGDSLSSTQANFNGNNPYGGAPTGPYLERTCRVGSYQPNGFGLYDMHGNVEEWCADWYGRGYYRNSPGRDPQGPSQGSSRVIRGGSWNYHSSGCRSAVRNWNEPWYRDSDLGFRLALSYNHQPKLVEKGLIEKTPEGEGFALPPAKSSPTGPGEAGGSTAKESGTDRFGARIGSRKAQINALLSAETPKTVKQIREEGGIPGSYVDYLDELAKRGIVTGNHKDGWVLVKGSPADPGEG